MENAPTAGTSGTIRRRVSAALTRRFPAARQRALNATLAAAERLAGAGPVLVPEYDLDPRPRWGWDGAPVNRAVAEVLDRHVDDALAILDDAVALLDWARDVVADPAGPRFDDDYWGGLDALVQCALLRFHRPARYVEIGSGNSTRFARRVVDDFSLPTTIVSIDPAPRAEIDGLCDEVVRAPLQEVGVEPFADLAADDVVLLDGSHVAMVNSDATVFLLEVLPSLPAGVVVGVDDVFWPCDYPPTWERRPYGEQYVVGGLLLGGAWRCRLAGMHVCRHPAAAGALEQIWPVVESRFGRVASTMWMQGP